jgi:urease gamma subunit
MNAREARLISLRKNEVFYLLKDKIKDAAYDGKLALDYFVYSSFDITKESVEHAVNTLISEGFNVEYDLEKSSIEEFDDKYNFKISW